ncbi:flagellar hook-length control protein FliK [Microcella daejeonensis]|uniref:flagellar hook-length control protein FliK n=1 Tax=Microcella daejeonensis TaxID=2994971 RepID=UPI002271C731|nr:flagellar hook-length control protein FliK [Microcella daejeonensis]WAB83885.1 flagellar hook-length control protein FliK [Microcella daejeonensis]
MMPLAGAVLGSRAVTRGDAPADAATGSDFERALAAALAAEPAEPAEDAAGTAPSSAGAGSADEPSAPGVPVPPALPALMPDAAAAGATTLGSAAGPATAPPGVEGAGSDERGPDAERAASVEALLAPVLPSAAPGSSAVAPATAPAVSPAVGAFGVVTVAPGAPATTPAAASPAGAGTAGTAGSPSLAAAPGALAPAPAAVAPTAPAGSTASGAPGQQTPTAPLASLPTATADGDPLAPAPGAAGSAATSPSALPALAPAAPATAPPPAPPASGAAPASPPAPVPAAPLSPQLAPAMLGIRSAGPGSHTVTVSITPEHLGPVTIRAVVDADGIRLELIAPTDAAREAVRAAMPDLRRDLGEAAAGWRIDVADREAGERPAGDRADARSDQRDARETAAGDAPGAERERTTLGAPGEQLPDHGPGDPDAGHDPRGASRTPPTARAAALDVIA